MSPHLVIVAGLFDRSGHHNARNAVVFILLVIAACLLVAGRNNR